MTWKEVKEQMEEAGVRNDTEIDWIDTSGSFTGKISVYYNAEKNVVCVSGAD